MAEVVVGVLESGIMILGFVVRFRQLASKLRNADDWRRYCDGLETLHCISTAIEEVNRSTSGSNTLTVTIGGKTENLLNYCNSQLEQVVTIAQRCSKQDRISPKHKAKSIQGFLCGTA
ncbi:hypothetical protein BU24DRAFT_425849 [Aaosphaeria arxii CBS 175.79]|uniref:Uncharacterized protein n=1 Tax=Aaosphaeria arxii CBS 175.79 TaxID=1450172 RepID=A0A6A5XG23_9PLEO|nr:uncharacterized protein BU24DRAFT_425849 [Aaosphaeria arxii CBS 175.79]KAF2012032.1 hypothetical protein BU24DRAFT_425849 [Aaosphaeria arxii CBS 175.79]